MIVAYLHSADRSNSWPPLKFFEHCAMSREMIAPVLRNGTPLVRMLRPREMPPTLTGT